jgi:hypothetical protein
MRLLALADVAAGVFGDVYNLSSEVVAEMVESQVSGSVDRSRRVRASSSLIYDEPQACFIFDTYNKTSTRQPRRSCFSLLPN